MFLQSPFNVGGMIPQYPQMYANVIPTISLAKVTAYMINMITGDVSFCIGDLSDPSKCC